ncbi:tRNA pseudouridine synthase D [Fistulina hepatica ATCC 64428]|nr:tRNA pseudouridine synthase D [Fistulina hepatica ATCC 64428]
MKGTADTIAQAFTQKEASKDASREHILPPSHVLLGIPLPTAEEGQPMNFKEADVGISEYIGRGLPKLEGIIKQRFTDFLVFEINQDHQVLHLNSLEMPESSKDQIPAATSETKTDAPGSSSDASKTAEHASGETEATASSNEPWPEHFTTALAPYLSQEAIEKVKHMYLEGPEPPRVSDSGWAGRVPRTEGEMPSADVEKEPEPESGAYKRGNDRGRGRGRGRSRGGRGGRGGAPHGREDTRKVLSEPIESKATRAELHQKIRELFGGKLDTETDKSTSDVGDCIVIKWGGRGGRGGGRGGGRNSRGNFPPYIHFTMQKTNRDTQDALQHLSRSLHVNVKELAVAGTKDKRGVTVQRVSLKRNGKLVEDVWRMANGVGPKRPPSEALKRRGDRGIRIADLNYRKAALELGMLKGNAFIITLRNVKTDSMETIDTVMRTMKEKGFINYYGMQRFGTASVPTHAIGLALLREQWQQAIALILQKRPGEHPDVAAARDAWLVDKNLDKALELMPRRVIAERCILESYKKQKGDTRNAMGTLSTIPKNLRLMYIHAYQSYVWNAIVSERIRMFGSDKPVVGDVVYESEGSDKRVDDMDAEDADSSRYGDNRRKWVAPKVKTLVEEDLDKYTIFDVVMPLPGTDVAYPGGKLGERYREFLRMDGLDPEKFERKQKQYTLNGSYRHILHLPKELSWSVLCYTDPDIALAQADEDKLLGFDPPVIDENGKFTALQINIALGTASYATMALREITKTETSSHFQSSLTSASEDQKYRSIPLNEVEDETVVTETEVNATGDDTATMAE